MTVDRNHPWDLTPAEAIQLQSEIARRIKLEWDDSRIELIGGADVSYLREFNRAFAVIRIFRISKEDNTGLRLRSIESKSASVEIRYPYIPGLFTFREGPALESVWNQLEHRPDLLIFDGAGIAHPRQCGLACHLGWRWNVRAFGVAKSRLYGEAGEVGNTKGDAEPLMYKQTQLGYVIRTRSRVKPVYVSPGHRTTLEVVRQWTMKTVTKYKLPEPTRQADLMTKQMAREFKNRMGQTG